MVIQRPLYLNQLIAAKGNRMIKIVTGIRRCGKSFLLFELFYNHLITNGVREDHIIKVDLEDHRNSSLCDPDRLIEYIDSRMTDKGMYYILLDEVQKVGSFVDVLNSYLKIGNADVYATGSNSRFLSKDVVTEFRGRGQDIHMFPLSFSEYYYALGGDRSLRYRDYSAYGGLPQIILLDSDKTRKEYLMHLNNSVYLSDVIERHKIRHQEELEELLRTLASSIGSPCNPNKLSNTFRSLKSVTISPLTVSKYLNYFCDAFLIEKAMRYDVKGKKYINTLSKYYFTDIGLRNAILGFRQNEPTHIMENIIYNTLMSQGFSVDVGIVERIEKNKDGRSIRKQFEVDFVVNNADKRYYIQSAYAIPDEEKMCQESNSLCRIADGFKRIIIVRDDIIPYYNDYGILMVGLLDFLLNPDIIVKN